MMLCLGGAISKGGRAEITFIRSIASVCVHVSHQLLVLNKSSSTDSAMGDQKIVKV